MHKAIGGPRFLSQELILTLILNFKLYTYKEPFDREFQRENNFSKMFVTQINVWRKKFSFMIL